MRGSQMEAVFYFSHNNSLDYTQTRTATLHLPVQRDSCRQNVLRSPPKKNPLEWLFPEDKWISFWSETYRLFPLLLDLLNRK